VLLLRRSELLLLVFPLLLACAPAPAAVSASAPVIAAPAVPAAIIATGPSSQLSLPGGGGGSTPKNEAAVATQQAAPSTMGTPAPAVVPANANVNDALAGQLMAAHSSNVLKQVLASPERYRFQVLYAPVKNGVIERHGYRADAEYYFPASTMKVPITLASYAQLGVLKTKKMGLTRETTMRLRDGSTTLARETWKALIISDNFSANRLLGFVGHKEAHQTLWAFGFNSTRIHSGFATGADIDPATQSPKIDISMPDGSTQELLPARKSDLVLPPTDAQKLMIGESNVVDGRKVPGPLSFAEKNAIRLRDLQDVLVRIMKPELLPRSSAPDPTAPDDLAYLRQTLGTLPSASGLPGYDRNVVADYQLMPFLRGLERVRPRSKFQIFSKVGQAYGFLIHNAYVVDKETGKSFFLTAAIYANPDEVMNDDTYAYDSISFPALADVGETFARHAFGS
jgi:hypothetical protein